MVRPVTARIELICDYCGKIFQTTPSRRKQSSKYCSRECMGKAERSQNKIIINGDCAEIHMKHNIIALIDIDDIEKVKQFSWYAVKRTLKKFNDIYYVMSSSRVLDEPNKKRKRVSLHRLITNCPEGLEVDHLNHNPLDNRKSNLRICTQIENAQNRRDRRKNEK